jgi:hypothetical protein
LLKHLHLPLVLLPVVVEPQQEEQLLRGPLLVAQPRLEQLLVEL